MTTTAITKPDHTIRLEMQRHRETVRTIQRAAAGVADDDQDQLRSGYVFGWLLAALAVNVALFGYIYGGLAFLTAFVQAALVAVTFYVVIRLYREWRADRAFWLALRAYLNRHSGQR